MVEIGKIIRAFRNQRKLTLKELAQKAGISPSYLSQIENDQVNMNMSVLESISSALGTPIYMLFLHENINSISHITKFNRNHIQRNDGVSLEPLIDTQAIKMDINIMTFPANYHACEYASHQGDEFFLVLEGSLIIDFSGYKTVCLEDGDSLAFSSRIPHSISSEHGCKVLVHSATPPIGFI